MTVELPRFDEEGRRRRARRAGASPRRPARDDGARPDARPVRRPAARPAGRLAGELRRPCPVHAGVAGGAHVVDRRLATRVAREFARNAEVTQGRSMIAMGAGTNHWFHSDTIYRTFLVLLLVRAARAGTAAAGRTTSARRRCVRCPAGSRSRSRSTGCGRRATSPERRGSTSRPTSGDTRASGPRALRSGGRGLLRGKHVADLNALGARLGWLPSLPTFDRNPLDLVDEAEAAGLEPAEHVVRELREGRLRFACEDPDAPENVPRVLTVWRANILGSSGKGHEYFLKHLLGAPKPACAPTSPSGRAGRRTSCGGRTRRRGSSTC